LYVARRYDEAKEQLRKTLEMDQGFPQAHVFLGLVYQQEGRDREALAEVQKAVDLSGRPPEILSALGYVYAVSGRREASKILDEMKEQSKRTYVSADWIAIIYAGLGEKDQAFVWLEKAYENHDLPVDLKVDPKWDRLRSDPRFAELLRRVGLA
jgi:tetratricopeptide (TPR) repeat protein